MRRKKFCLVIFTDITFFRDELNQTFINQLQEISENYVLQYNNENSNLV